MNVAIVFNFGRFLVVEGKEMNKMINQKNLFNVSFLSVCRCLETFFFQEKEKQEERERKKERKKRNSKEKCFRHAYVKRERESLGMGIKQKENERKIWCVYYVIKQKQKKLGGGILIKESCFNFVSCYCEEN